MSHKAREHLRKADPKLSLYMERIQLEDLMKSKNLFSELCDIIISQQLSGKAAATIFERFKKLFPNKIVSMDRLLTLSNEEIRTCGASWAKVRSLKDLATKVSNGSVKLHLLDEMSDVEVKNHLIQIKGVGPWTAEMFLMFALVREDVFSMGDLGLKKGMMKVYGFRKDPSLAQIEKIVSRWKPYRSYASRILWKSLEIDSA